MAVVIPFGWLHSLFGNNDVGVGDCLGGLKWLKWLEVAEVALSRRMDGVFNIVVLSLCFLT